MIVVFDTETGNAEVEGDPRGIISVEIFIEGGVVTSKVEISKKVLKRRIRRLDDNEDT